MVVLNLLPVSLCDSVAQGMHKQQNHCRMPQGEMLNNPTFLSTLVDTVEMSRKVTTLFSSTIVFVMDRTAMERHPHGKRF